MPLQGKARARYMREYMQRRRAAERDGKETRPAEPLSPEELLTAIAAIRPENVPQHFVDELACEADRLILGKQAETLKKSRGRK